MCNCIHCRREEEERHAYEWNKGYKAAQADIHDALFRSVNQETDIKGTYFPEPDPSFSAGYRAGWHNSSLAPAAILASIRTKVDYKAVYDEFQQKMTKEFLKTQRKSDEQSAYESFQQKMTEEFLKTVPKRKKEW